MGIRTLKEPGAARKEKQQKSIKKRLLLVLKGVSSIVLVLGLFFLIAWGRYAKQQFFGPPGVYIQDFTNGALEISPGAAFVIPFDQRMNKDTVRKAISIIPEKEGSWEWESKTLLIKPHVPFKTGEKYVVSIDTSATSIFGQPLASHYELQYVIGLSPQIKAVYPEALELTDEDGISILFSHPMVLHQEMERASAKELFTLMPPVNGQWTWYNQKAIAFRPSTSWDLSTRYQLIQKDVIQTLGGERIEENVERVFETERFALDEKFISGLQQNPVRKIGEALVVSFNQEPSSESANSMIEVRDSKGRKVALKSVKNTENNKELLLRPAKGNWDYDEQYIANIKEGLMPQQGNLGLNESTEFAFQGESFFFPIGGEEKEYYYLPEEKRVVFQTKEEIPERLLNENFFVSPSYPFDITQSEKKISIDFKENAFSQKRENIVVTYSIKDKEGLTAKVTELTFKPAKKLEYQMQEKERILCVFSNMALHETSTLIGLENGQRSLARIENGQNDDCGERNELLPFTSYFEKKYFSPNTTHDLEMRLVDKHNRITITPVTLVTSTITTDQRYLYTNNLSEYKHVSNAEDLQMDFQSKNIESLILTVCQLEAKKALAIETTYEQRWYSFDPDPEECIRFERRDLDVKVQWGKEQKESVLLPDVMDKLQNGIYFVHVVAPGYFNEQGEPLEALQILQLSAWNMLSKRGRSPLVWLSSSEDSSPVKNAQVSFVSNDGLVLETHVTGDDGSIYLENTDIKYGYLMARKGKEELLMSAFSQEGIEPARFDISQDVREQKRLHQFYLEDPSLYGNTLQGVFILKEQEEGRLLVPNVSQAVIAVYDQQEKLLWRSFHQFDEYGSFQFEIPKRNLIVDERYQIEACVGLHQGVCHGESYWAFFSGTGFKGNKMSEMRSEVFSSSETKGIQKLSTEEREVGNEVKFQISGLEQGVPFLFAVEREGVYDYQVITPESESMPMSFTITEKMVPEVMISVTQFGAESFLADMKRISVKRKTKTLHFQKSPEKINEIVFLDDNNQENKDVESFYFTLYGAGLNLENKASEAFYPRIGTRVISAANIPDKFLQDKTQNLQPFPQRSIPDVVIINGKLFSPGEESAHDFGKMYVVAHDKQGHFANLVFGQEVIQKDIRLEASFPNFVRPADKVISEITVTNENEDLKNLQMIVSSSDLVFPQGAVFHVGVPKNEKRVIAVPFQLKGNTLGESASFSSTLANQSQILAAHSVILPVKHHEKLHPLSKHLYHHSNSLQVEIDPDFSASGIWNVTTIIAPTPVAYILENVRVSLASKTLGLEEMVIKMGLAGEFEQFVSAQDPSYTQQSFENELYYLAELQHADGSWSPLGENMDSEPVLSSAVVKSLSVLINANKEVPETMIQKAKLYLKGDLDRRSNERVRAAKKLSDETGEAVFEEMLILNALSSLSPTGVSYANSWYNIKEDLSVESLVLLLMTFEDYRDAGVASTEFRIEEILQLIHEKAQEANNKRWLTPEDLHSGRVSDFILTSWYLESLVRQASGRTEIPEVITWLRDQKDLTKNQYIAAQAAYVQAMSSYLKIYQAQVNSPVITVDTLTQSLSYDLVPNDPTQAIVLEEILEVEEDQEIPLIRISAENEQPLFVELIKNSEQSQELATDNGLTVFHSFSKKQYEVGEEIRGEIIVLSDQNYERIVLVQPQVGGALPTASEDEREGEWQVLSSNHDESWYLVKELSAGETRVPFTWTATHPGVYQLPPVYAYVSRSPDTYGISNSKVIEIR